jgi:hypothetical protein
MCFWNRINSRYSQPIITSSPGSIQPITTFFFRIHSTHYYLLLQDPFNPLLPSSSRSINPLQPTSSRTIQPIIAYFFKIHSSYLRLCLSSDLFQSRVQIQALQVFLIFHKHAQRPAYILIYDFTKLEAQIISLFL